MAITFEINRLTHRAHVARDYRQLTSKLLVSALVSLIVTAAVVWFTWSVAPSALLLGSALVLSSGGSALLLLFTFAVTYYPYLAPRPTLAQLQHRHEQGGSSNAAEAADLALLTTLRPVLKKPVTQRMATVLPAIIGSAAAQPVLHRLGIAVEELLTVSGTQVIQTLTWKKYCEDFTRIAWQREASLITLNDLLAALLLQPTLKNFLRQHDLQERDISFVMWWLEALQEARAIRRRWWDQKRLLHFTGIGLSWTSGFTPQLDRLMHFPQGNLWDQIMVGRERQVEQLITTLARQRQSNVLLVGQPGTGRLGVALAMAERVRTNSAHPALDGQRVVYVHVGEVVAQGATSAAQLASVSQVLAEMERAGNIIAVIDGLGSILGEAGEQRLNLSDTLLPFFSSLTVRVVVIVSSEEYHLRLKSHAELAHYFEVVQVESASAPVTLQVLAFAAPQLEARTRLFFPYTTLRTIVEETESVLPHIPNPERAFDILEEAVVIAQQKQVYTVEARLVEELISQKVGIPVGKVRDEEREHLLGLEELMHQRLVNQHAAVTTLARAMIRARADVRTRERPIGTFLFLGPTGVGKTEAAKTLAAAYFGSEDYLSRLDMSEFHGEDSVAALIGGSKQTVGRLTSLIADHPFTVLLLDEFEKASTAVHQLFLQILDEGRLTDARGQLFSFRHAIIIATSNAGAEVIREAVERGPLPTDFNDQLREHILREGIFRPELLNRFDGVVTFTPLSLEHIRQVALRMLQKLNKRLDAAHGVTVTVTPELVDYLVSVGYHPEFGARPMARAIQDTVEYAVAQRVIQGSITAGQRLTLSPAQLQRLQV